MKSGELFSDLQERNIRALRFVDYAIRKGVLIKGVSELLDNIALIKKRGNNEERMYHNALTEFHSIYFVQKILKYSILEVESQSNKIYSPFRSKEKLSCDILATDGKDKFYFEIKDLSKETITQYKSDGHIFFYPQDEEDIEKWLHQKCKEAMDKGANFLISRVPVWRAYDEDESTYFKSTWIKKVFKNYFTYEGKISDKVFLAKPLFRLNNSFKAVYLIKRNGYLKIELVKFN